jgi:hypothetical protein
MRNGGFYVAVVAAARHSRRFVATQAPNKPRFAEQTLELSDREASWSHIMSHIQIAARPKVGRASVYRVLAS